MDAICERDFFLRFPSVFWPAIGTFTCYTSVESAKRTDGFHVVVRAKCQGHFVLQHGSPGVSAHNSLAPDTILGPAHVRCLMGSLHGSNNVEFRESGEIHRRDDLRVLDAIAPVAFAVGFGDSFENVERNPIGTIPNRMEGKLKAGL